ATALSLIDNFGRRLVNFDVQKTDSGYQVTFQDRPTLQGLHYFLYSPKAIKKPIQIVADQPSNLKSSQNGADYILITHELFRNAAQLLAEHRQAQNLRVALIDVQDIYDEFNDGIFDPWAIQKFLKYAYENWQPPAPLYVLLLGDATWACDKSLARSWRKTCFIPSVMKYTYSWGLTSSDNAFVCVSGDDRLPDMFIGRLPVNTIEEARTVIDKIIQYEKQPLLGEWRKRICLACGDDPFFERSADYLAQDYIPASFEVPRLYTNPRSKYFGSTQELVGLFNNGVALLNFIGHGGGGVFFDADLFLLEDIVLLKNPRTLPVIFSLTCFIGYFDNPWTPSLGEELLRAKDKGCIATFGSAGRAWLYGDYFLNNALFEALFKNGLRHLGQVTTQAKWRMITWTGSYWDHVENYNLLGDPALRIGFPSHPIDLEIHPSSVPAGETFTIRGKLPLPLNGPAKVQLIDSSEAIFQEHTASVSAGRFELTLPMPFTNAGSALAKAYFWNETSDGIGSAPFGIEAPAFTEISTIPSSPGHRDSIFFRAKIEVASKVAPSGIDSAVCQISYTQASWENFSMHHMPDGRFQTEQPLIANEGSKIYYRIQAFYRAASNFLSNSITSQIYSFTVNRRADLRFLAPELQIFGRESVMLQTKVFNKGETDARNFTVEFFEGDPDDEKKIIDPVRIFRLAAGQDTILQSPWPNQPSGRHRLVIRIDAEQHVPESNESNNEIQKQLHLITLMHGSAGPIVSADSNFSITISPSSMPSNCSGDIHVRSAAEMSLTCPIPSGFIPVGSQENPPRCYELRFDPPDAQLLQPFSIRFKWAKEQWEKLPRVYAWDGVHQHWSYRPAQLDSSDAKLIATALASDAIFGLFYVNDPTPPLMSIRIENQNFAGMDYVSSHPIISVSIEDESGIDLQNQPPELYLNNQKVDLTNSSVWFSPQSNKIAVIRFSPTLVPGEHVIKIRAADLAGNWSEQTLAVTVSGEFALQALANHPNPFVNETIIAYTLTDEAELVSLNIYTVSGRLIRRFEFTNEVGYIEHVWDGCDETGDPVANGIYYLKFIARKGNQKIERIEKLAKLR
ncbi:MAG: C25 family cysteine peptidase, partial [candidate division KSB1 bacterium]|nr:C25 family cysteine peptidase [candidate division KSB1 bacterium]